MRSSRPLQADAGSPRCLIPSSASRLDLCSMVILRVYFCRCPRCRGICNCRTCRRAQGLEPTGYGNSHTSLVGSLRIRPVISQTLLEKSAFLLPRFWTSTLIKRLVLAHSSPLCPYSLLFLGNPSWSRTRAQACQGHSRSDRLKQANYISRSVDVEIR